ncbi:hypothetical protein PR048_011330 [Dryococelus australis]|uniref:Integrase catalytic domain-containing protein n=1 Tax=Dryococelus australis TaxID=614101 RepID=A0ABQ9HLA5_9NEOP|nr:hypothetical protein PR048_011330 [Dryococelus australis]
MIEPPETTKPFQRIGIDIVGPLQKTTSGKKYILTIIDHFSRYLDIHPNQDENAESVTSVFVCDWILNMVVCKLFKITKLHTTPGHPEGNGRTERVHHSMAGMINLYINNNHNNWDVNLPTLCCVSIQQLSSHQQET